MFFLPLWYRAIIDSHPRIRLSLTYHAAIDKGHEWKDSLASAIRNAEQSTGITAMTSKQRDPARHAEKMARKAAAREKIMAGKQTEKGLLIVHTGKGKGKSTAAFGMVLRALGHGMKVAVIQFIKGQREIGERKALEAIGGNLSFFACGEGFTWETRNLEQDRRLAARTWEEAQRALADESIRLVMLDELNVVLKYGYLDTQRVLAAISRRPPMQHVTVTGRNAPEELVEAADLVTEMKLVKHPFRSGVRGQPGIEF